MSANINPYSHLAGAAQGNIACQRALAACGEVRGLAARDLDSLIDGLAFARMAAMHGNRNDIATFIRMLAAAESMCANQPWFAERRKCLQAELIAVTSLLADFGCGEAEGALEAIVECFSPEAVATAKGVRKLLEEV